ncbi:MAG: sigma-70 family RNA polymerase sigma factor [Terrimicrobiaceae bacterium]|nr:sigma-70 family RNA polymerase sigma factor [Terrimicrobiaceae bacterium]
MGPSEPSGDSDWDLAERAKQGDESAYARLVERYQAPIHGFIFRSVGDVETARDLAQEVFVRAWFALARVRAKAKFSTWLFQIAVNLCRDHVKSKATRNARNTESFARRADDERAEDREFASPELSPAEDAETREAIDALEAEIRALPDELRSSFVLGAVEHQPYKEVASALGLSAKAVEVRIYRARRLLGERLRRLGFRVSE